MLVVWGSLQYALDHGGAKQRNDLQQAETVVHGCLFGSSSLTSDGFGIHPSLSHQFLKEPFLGQSFRVRHRMLENATAWHFIMALPDLRRILN